MSTFEQAIPVIMSHEGTDTNFWVDDKDDLGGQTVWGWSMSTIKSLGLTPRDLGLDQDVFTPTCLKAVKKSVCQELYRKHFWEKFGFGNIADQTAATKCFDASINMGPSRACKVVQCALDTLVTGACKVDGVWGPQTFKAINATLPGKFVKAYSVQLLAYYQSICESRPQNKKFLPNWTKRSQWGLT
jgi:lysozyme family protein